MEKKSLYGVILAGGSGSRLWPLSREMYPKQLLKLTGEHTLFQSTFCRLFGLIYPQNIFTVVNTKHSTDIRLQLNQLKDVCKNIEDPQIIVEPIGRNTAPAIGLAVKYIINKINEDNFDPIIFVAPSDHIIQDQQAFNDAVDCGIKLAEAGFIATFGIKPNKPDTGYGYICTESREDITKICNEALKVKEFKEKPDLETAQEYIKSQNYYWNSGMFIFKASTLLKEMELYSNDIYTLLNEITFNNEGPTVDFNDYIKIPDNSIDYAIMERSSLITLIPLLCDWSDMGSWEAIYDISQRDSNNNFISGNVIDFGSENSLIYSTSKLVSTIGMKDTVIVETNDAILVCDKNKTQDVKKIFNLLKSCNNDACFEHSTVYRPWGYYTVLEKAEDFLVKIININVKAKLSLQMHYHRSEHWVVLSGIAQIIKGDKELFLNPGDSIDIPATIKHSLANPGKIDLKIIEVQRGNYLKEDDIIRFEDIYGRMLTKV